MDLKFFSQNQTVKASLPLDEDTLQAIDAVKHDLAYATLQPIDESLSFTVETDASDFAIAASLNQDGRPVAFHSRSLSASEQRHSAVEKEAYAVVEALRKWRDLLIGKHFTLGTDQKSVSFMLDARHANKIKTDKIVRWRLQLTSYSYTVVHRPGIKNVGPDTLTRTQCGYVQQNRLRELHVALCHTGSTRMGHFVCTKNLPLSLTGIREMACQCEECQQIKPHFVRSNMLDLSKRPTFLID